MGLVVDPAVNAVKALIASLSFPADRRSDRESTSTPPGAAS